MHKRFMLTIVLVVSAWVSAAHADDRPLAWRPSWTADQYRAAIRHPLSRTSIPTVPANLDAMTVDSMQTLIRNAASDMCHQVPHDALVANMRLMGFAEQMPEAALRTANDAFNRGNVFIGNSSVNRAAGAADGSHVIYNNLQATQAIDEMMVAHPTVPRTAAAARLGPIAERRLARFGNIRTVLGYNRQGATVWARWGGVAQRGTRVLGWAGTAFAVWNCGSAMASGNVPEARRVIGGTIFPIVGELTADQLTLAEDYTNREYERMQADLDREQRIAIHGQRAVERAEGGRRIPSPDGRSMLSVNGPGLNDVSEQLWTSYGQAVNRRDEAAARRILEMIRSVCNRSPPDD